MSLDPNYKKFVAQKLHEKYPKLTDASDDEIIEVGRQLSVPDASPNEWHSVLKSLYPAPEKPASNLPALIGAGAVGLGLGALAGAAHIKSAGKIEDVMKLGEKAFSPVEMPENVRAAIEKVRKPKALPVEDQPILGTPITPEVQPVTPMPVPTKVASPMATTPEEPSAPKPSIFSPEEGVLISNVLKRLKSDPEYLARQDMLGGGKTVSHTETWTKALNSPVMTVDELSNWKAGTPTNEVDIARANLLRTHWFDRYLQAAQDKDFEALKQAQETLTKIEPGYDNLKGTPGRATEIQKVFKLNEEVLNKLDELRALNAPAEQIKREIDPLLKKAEELDKQTNSKWGALLDHMQDFATSAKLTSPVTHAINTISNMYTWVQRIAEQTVAGGVLAASGHPIEAQAVISHALGTTMGLRDGMSKAGEILAGNRVDYGKGERGKTIRKVLPIVDQPFRLLGAADAIWKGILQSSEIATKAHIQAAKDEGLVGEELMARIKQLASNPPKSWQQEAMDVAKEYTFQEDPDRLMAVPLAIQRIPGIGRLIVPFVQTPANILKFYVRRSPMGILSPRLWAEIKNPDPVKQAEAVGKFAIGLGLSTAAFTFFHSGELTGGFPSSPAERKQWIAANKKPWSMRIGDHWFAYNRIQPLGLFLMSAAAVHSALDDNKFDKADKKFQKLLLEMVQGPMQLSFLQGMSSLVDFLNDPEKNTKNLEKLVVSGFIPNFSRWVRSFTDPIERKPTSIGEAIKAMIPGKSQEVPARLTALGREVPEEKSAFLRSTRMVFPSTDSKKTELMAKLGWAPPVPDPTLEFKDINDPIETKTIELKEPMRSQFVKDMGLAADKGMDLLMSRPEFDAWRDTIKKKKLTETITNLQEPLRVVYKAGAGLYGPEYQKKFPELLQKVREKIQGATL